MSLRAWAGFLPSRTVVMVRRAAKVSASSAVEAPPRSWRPAESAAPVPHLKPSSSPSVSPQSSGVRRVLLYLESEPHAVDRQFLLKMMAAIDLSERDVTMEWGEFPEAKTPIVLGVGLEGRKSSRLAALRPDRFELPALARIQSEPSVKREAWETLKRLARALRERSGGQT